jgi:hypothetical protein
MKGHSACRIALLMRWPMRRRRRISAAVWSWTWVPPAHVLPEAIANAAVKSTRPWNRAFGSALGR